MRGFGGGDDEEERLHLEREVGCRAATWPTAPRTATQLRVTTPFAGCRALQASVRVRASQDNVAGVRLPKFEHFKDGTDSKLALIGLGNGGKQIQDCR